MEEGDRAEQVLLKDTVAELKDELIGQTLCNDYDKWRI